MCPTPRARRVAALSLTLLALIGSPQLAYSQTYDDYVAAAAEKFERQDLMGAIEDFKKAYELRAEPNILYNIARLYEEAGKFEEAVAYYDQFVVLPGIDIESRQDALTRLKTLREILALRKKDEPKADPEPGPKPGPEAKPKPEPDRTMAYIFLGTGAGALVGSGVFALLTQSAHASFQSAPTLEERRSAASSGSTYGALSDGLLVGGVALATLGVIFWATASPEQAPSSPSPGARLAPVLGPDRVGLHYSLDF